MTMLSQLVRQYLMAAFAAVTWLGLQQTAAAQPLLAQSGLPKTMIGWLLVLLSIGLGLLVVCRPSGRRPADK
jgi:hypothetical protein